MTLGSFMAGKSKALRNILPQEGVIASGPALFCRGEQSILQCSLSLRVTPQRQCSSFRNDTSSVIASSPAIFWAAKQSISSGQFTFQQRLNIKILSHTLRAPTDLILCFS
jgi:hypothetical protein